MKADDARRLKDLERENARLKRIVADKELEITRCGRPRREAGEPVEAPPSVAMLRDRLGKSQRQACQIVGQHRSAQRHQPAEPDPDREFQVRLRCFAKQHPRWATGEHTPCCAMTVTP
jgi:hypothetical protein